MRNDRSDFAQEREQTQNSLVAKASSMAGGFTPGLPVRLLGKQILLTPERFSKNVLV